MNKNHILTIASFVILMLALTIPSMAAVVVPASSQTNNTTTDAQTQQLIQRLNEIKAMDKSSLTRTEKKSLRKELQQTKREMKATSQGVYLSVGAIIIIILLLILIL